MVKRCERLLRHLLLPPWQLQRMLPRAAMTAIEAAIVASERRHCGQICFAIEATLTPLQLLRELSARERALQVFAELGVWDTAGNNGVLIYVLLADKDVEIVADRAIAGRVDPHCWEKICTGMERAFRTGDFGRGSLEAIAGVGALLERHYPGSGHSTNTVSDAPVIL